MRLVSALLPLALAAAALQLVGVAPAVAAPATLYAYAAGTRTAAGCPADTTATPANECSLAQTIARSTGGDTIALATSGDQAHYVGNWAIDTPGTSATTPVTLTAAPGLTAPPVLDGNHGSATGCTTSTCSSAVLQVSDSVTAVLDGLDVVNGSNATGNGGGVDAEGDGLTIVGCRFTGNSAAFGGAVASNSGAAPVVVTDSAFMDNTGSIFGGAIETFEAPVTVLGSVFDSNQTDEGGFGGAVYNFASALTVTGSSFTANLADYGGAISTGYDNFDAAGGGATLAVSDSYFGSNTAVSGGGGAILNAFEGMGTVTVLRTSIVSNTAPSGGAIDNANGGIGTVRVLDSTLTGNAAASGGGIINGSIGGSTPGVGTLVVAGSTLSGDVTDPKYGERTHGKAKVGLRAGTSTPSEVTSVGDGSTVVTAGSLFAGACLVPETGWTDDGHNAATDASCVNKGAGDLVSAAAARLKPVTAAGVVALVPTNPAIGLVPRAAEAGSVALCPRTDQTGHITAAGAACDAGAVDSPAPVRPTLTLTGGHSVAVGSTHSFTGRARPGAAVTLYDGTTRLAATTASSTGTYRFSTEVSRSGRYTTVADHQTSAVLAIRAVKLTLVVSGKRPWTTGVHRVHGAAPAGRVVRLLVDGHVRAHTTVTAGSTYAFMVRLTGSTTLRIVCDGVRSAAVTDPT